MHAFNGIRGCWCHVTVRLSRQSRTVKNPDDDTGEEKDSENFQGLPPPGCKYKDKYQIDFNVRL